MTFTVVAVLFLILGTGINPTVASFVSSLVNPPRKPMTKYGFAQFEMPQIVKTGEPSIVFLSCNVTGDDPISEGNLVDVFVEVYFTSNIQYEISHIEVRPDNAFWVIYSTSGRRVSEKYASVIFTQPSKSSFGTQVWWGRTLIELGAAGVFGATVDIAAVPSPEYWNVTGSNLQTTMHFHSQMATITIEPYGGAQQDLYEDQNLSLTFFILFFASVDIAVTLYDHSYEEIAAEKNDTSQNEEKRVKEEETEDAAHTVVATKNGEHKNHTTRHRGKSKQDQGQKV